MSYESNTESESDITLLVLERGAEWPSWGTGIRMRAPNSAVEVQADEESTEDFAGRVEARLDGIRKSGMRLRAAGYACSVVGAGRRDARRRICERLLEQLDAHEGAEVILAGGAWETSGEEGVERSSLIQLWSELSQGQPGRMMSIRFEDPPTESGVFRAAEKLRDSRPLHDSVRPIADADQHSWPPSESLRR